MSPGTFLAALAGRVTYAGGRVFSGPEEHADAPVPGTAYPLRVPHGAGTIAALDPDATQHAGRFPRAFAHLLYAITGETAQTETLRIEIHARRYADVELADRLLRDELTRSGRVVELRTVFDDHSDGRQPAQSVGADGQPPAFTVPIEAAVDVFRRVYTVALRTFREC